MSVASASALPISDWQPLQESTLELHHGCAEFEQALELLFQDIDSLRSELTDQMLCVERERAQLKLRESRLSERQQSEDGDVQRLQETLQTRDRQLAEVLDELEAARKEKELVAQRAQEAAQAVAQTSDLTAQLAALRASMDDMQRGTRALERERDALQASASNSAAQVARIADLERELLDVRQQLAEVQTQVHDTDLARSQPSTDDVNALALTALEQEREALESELELVRNRAAELNETVARQEREIAAQKNELGSELQQLRKLVEKQADLIADRVVSGRETPVPAASAATASSAPANDPVVNSVMAQFAKLQKDVAQRRKRKV